MNLIKYMDLDLESLDPNLILTNMYKSILWLIKLICG